MTHHSEQQVYYRLSHKVVILRCRSQRFDCLLLVFFRWWGRLVTRYHLYHTGGLWLVHFNPHCSSEKLLPQWSVVLPFSCCVSWSWASTLWEFQFRYPCWYYQGVPVRSSINKLYLVPKRIMAGLVGVLRHGRGLGYGRVVYPCHALWFSHA